MTITITRSEHSKQAELESIKVKTIAEFEDKIGSLRNKIMTPILGQDYVYQSKYAEAMEFINTGSSSGPFLTREAEARNVDVNTIVTIVLSSKQVMDSNLADLEVLRFNFKEAISNVTSKQELSNTLLVFEEMLQTYED
jgi:hypothetical protein